MRNVALTACPPKSRIHETQTRMARWPVWWDWRWSSTLTFTVAWRDRDFTEVDLRSMLQSATRVRRDVEPGRWIINTRLQGQRWEASLEPDVAEQRLIVITAYPMVS